MRPTSPRPVLLLCAALALSGCAVTTGADEDTTARPSEPPAASPTPSAPPPDAPSAPPTRTDLGTDVLLPAEAWEPVSAPRSESTDAAPWWLPEACGAVSPASATAVLTAVHGDGQAEGARGVQQVAVFGDVDAAVAEADRIGQALATCGADGAAAPTRYVAEPLAVGAQGTGLASDHYGQSPDGGLDGAMGTYAAVTRRGTAVTLVALDGGEGTVGAARERITAQAYAAWELLCPYDAAGC